MTYDAHMAKIHFVRHGRTVLNEQHRTQGSADSPLTPSGREGAVLARDFLADYPLTRVYLSPLGRVIETTDILTEGRELPRTILTGLREYDYGIYDGGPDPEMLAALPTEKLLPGVLSGRFEGAPEGISATDYLRDIDGALARILADLRDDAEAGKTDAEALAVSHGMTIMTIMARWIGLEVYSKAPMANCAITTVEIDPTAPGGAPRLIDWALDPGNQGVTFPATDMSGVFDGVDIIPIDFTRPEGL